jgi:rubrerythrin
VIFSKRAVRAEQDTASLVEEFKNRVGATEITAESVREIIKEKTVIVKVRCPYCSNLYDEALDKCPYCGGHQ